MPQDHFIIADETAVAEVYDRLARGIVLDLPSNLRIVGIRRRGVPVAEQLQRRVAEKAGSAPPLGELTYKRYTDDLAVIHEAPAEGAGEIDFGVRDRHVLLVDDVLYTGRTLMRATEKMLSLGAATVMTAVLCDRCAAEVPLAATFAGMRLEVRSQHIVEVRTPPYEQETAIVIRERPAS